MASITIKPTRMELNRIKARLKVARRGHKLLKDKRDELMRQFMLVIKENRLLREKVESGLAKAMGAMSVASALMSPEMLEQALLYPKQSVEVRMKYKNIMGVNVPEYEFRTKNDDPSEIFPYSYAMTSGELDDAISILSETLDDMLELARVEKAMQLLAQEIEKTRRRVNALEYVMIPEMEQNIKYIRMKLEENERGNITRLMKVKDAILKEAHGYETI
ncbi:MAG: V-type ATP synthase subunit D [Clostridiales bacterium]|nr:V-type ATP synthase subunit D [Clostridiales bacterium]